MREYKFRDIKLGLEESFNVNLSEEMLLLFKKVTGDINPLHNDLDFARSHGQKEKVVYGMLTSSFLSTLAGVYLPGKYSLIHEVKILFKKPVFLSDSPLTINGKVVDINDMFKQFTIDFSIVNKNHEKVVRGLMKVGVLDD